MRRARANGIGLALIALVLSGGALAAARAQQQEKIKASAVQVLLVESSEVKLPPEFQMALYENLIAELTKTGKFQHVYRDGDQAAKDAPDMVLLKSNVTGFKEGSARARQVTTVAGSTKIKVHVQFVGRDDKMLLERDINGNVHFMGENLRATYNFAKAVAKVVRENF